MIPSDREIEDLHRRYAPTPEAFDLVFTHCRIVRDLALQLLPADADVDAELVNAGALLHDVGVYRLQGAAYIRHGILGDALLRSLGLPDRLCRMCSHHTGVGLTGADVVAQELPLPVADYLAETPEEELVMYADKFHSKKSPPVFVSADTYTATVARFGEEKATRFKFLRSRYGDPDLAGLATVYGHATI
ncbi:HD domain-containing protein [Cryptosporangium phraense]|uniref:HD domain-containing protein n=1 Tax=Cryptosporangium phraense TaxID=2593070 RepID=A0A545B001_9ACTN|nr:HD domain-containing protein [Cryptosporangium phraense]TQS46901.1 HD domain-containing protein [Cryptosporangium phraense]